ncbi:MAG: tetratricopeptide repeat protein, partial [Planctomycetota bacterium]
MLDNSQDCLASERSRRRFSSVVLLSAAVLFCCAPSAAQESSETEQLLSSSVAREFFDIAYELANSPDGTAAEGQQAITFLKAADQLDPTADYYLPDLIRLLARQPDQDHSALMYELLLKYTNESIDLEVAGQAIAYLLQRQNSREEKEQLFAALLKDLGGKNKVLDSELATQLGLLMAEKPDAEAAKFYFLQAYNNNRYNRLAFARLAELVGDQIGPAIYLDHLRLALGANPLDLDTALAFANYAESLQLYEMAADAYEYCANLFRLLRPSEPLPVSIYLPWALSCYNTPRSQSACLQIASDLRQSGRFDLLLEAIAGRAALRAANPEQASLILQSAEAKAIALSDASAVSPAELAWFYCFALPDVNEAIQWANKAYSSDPTSASAAALLAYALVMDGQSDWAKLLMENYERNQIAELALARVQLAQGQKSEAVETLKSAIEKDPGSLAAERAKEILIEQGTQYVPPSDPNLILAALKAEFGQNVVPKFLTPDKIFTLGLKLQGSSFSYGSSLDAQIVITNNSAEPMIVSDEAMVKGNLTIDARVTGDLNEQIPNLLSIRFRPASPVRPGQTLFVPVQLATGRLRRILLAHPQASLNIEFAAFIDPVTGDRGRIISRLGIEPATVAVNRPGIELTRKYLQNRLDSLSKGRQGQKIKTARLFTGLFTEQAMMSGKKPLYKFASADWVPQLLKSSLTHSLTDDDWVVGVHAMAGTVSFSMDYELVGAVSENLADTRWPARLMAVFVLAKSGDPSFAKVLDWTAKYDTNTLVRQMAVALGGQTPEP